MAAIRPGGEGSRLIHQREGFGPPFLWRDRMLTRQLKQAAYQAGFDDAIHGRAYRESYQLGSEIRNAGFDKQYEAGWEAGRNDRQQRNT